MQSMVLEPRGGTPNSVREGLLWEIGIEVWLVKEGVLEKVVSELSKELYRI